MAETIMAEVTMAETIMEVTIQAFNNVLFKEHSLSNCHTSMQTEYFLINLN